MTQNIMSLFSFHRTYKTHITRIRVLLCVVSMLPESCYMLFNFFRHIHAHKAHHDGTRMRTRREHVEQIKMNDIGIGNLRAGTANADVINA